jgi:hypothetical protein
VTIESNFVAFDVMKVLCYTLFTRTEVIRDLNPTLLKLSWNDIIIIRSGVSSAEWRKSAGKSSEIRATRGFGASVER